MTHCQSCNKPPRYCYCAKKPTKVVLQRLRGIHGSVKNISTELRVSRGAVEDWIREYNLPPLKHNQWAKKSETVYVQVERYVLTRAGETLTVDEIAADGGFFNRTVVRVLRQLLEQGSVETDADYTNWYISDNETSYQKSRRIAGYPPLETWQGPLWIKEKESK